MTHFHQREQELDPALVLRAYAMGVFPMADDRRAPTVFWVEPKLRGILPLSGFHLSRSLRKVVASDRYRVTADTAFASVLRLCAEHAADRPETWINGPIERVFLTLFEMGFAHSVECWLGDDLVGGLYGLALGRAFFGESMVSRARDASKVAMTHLVARLRVGDFRLLDCQFLTEHLATLGAVEIPRDHYVSLLSEALGPGAAGLGDGAGVARVDGDWGALDRLGGESDPASSSTVCERGPVSGKRIVQLLGQTS